MTFRRPASQGSSSSFAKRALSVAVLSALAGLPVRATAQVTPDANAGSHRPGTGTAANGVPVVSLVAPSATGVSHNQYQQFNVDKQGLILNNSAGVSATQLGGYIVGNPNYRAGQSAKIIVNEVTSTNPTYLRGYTEVAGSAADVVIANPNGIAVNGGGFLNTNRATLTTGTPTFAGDGSLSGFQTRGGTISIDGDGLNASNIDRLDLIARSLTVNGGVWANGLNVGAGNDLTATNAQVVATNNVVLAAGNNLTVNAGESTYDYAQDNHTSHTGLMNNGGLSVLIGNRSTDQDATVQDTSYTGSTVGSLNGNVTLSAGNNVHITGSDVLSQTGTTIVGKNVTVDAAVGTADITQTQKVSQGGINVGIGGAAAQLANATYQSAQRGSDVHDDRLKALYAAQAAYQVSDVIHAAQGGVSQNGVDGGINLQVGIGGSSASNTTRSHDEAAYGSHITSQGNVTLAATDGDLTIVGSQIAGQDVALAASHDLNILSQAETHTLQSNNKNLSSGVGLQIGTDGIGIYAQAAGGQGSEHGNGVTHAISTVNANGTLTLISGNDTTIKGAQLTGQQVIGAIGNNLLIQSEQDTDDYASKQWQAGGKVVIGFGGGGGGVNYSQSKTNSHYASVTDVSGIQAGSDGFDITVGGNTHLIGGVIASSADPSHNLLNTGSLTYESIHNEANYSASSLSFSGGYNNGAGEFGQNGFSAAPNLGISQKDHSSSDTHAGIAQGTIIVRNNPNQDLSDLDRNPTLGNQALAPIFDAQKVQENMEAGQVAGYVGMRTAGSIADYMAKHATTDEEKASWSDGGTNKTLLHGLVGAATAALGGGNVLDGAKGAAAPVKDQLALVLIHAFPGVAASFLGVIGLRGAFGADALLLIDDLPRTGFWRHAGFPQPITVDSRLGRLSRVCRRTCMFSGQYRWS